MDRTATMPVSVVVARRAAASKWLDWTWKPVDVVPGAAPLAPWSAMREEGDVTLFHAGAATLELHRKDAEAYAINLQNTVPAVYVVMRESDDPAVPFRLWLVTVAPYEAAGYLVSASETVEAVPMPPPIRAFVEAFVAEHYAPEEFRKRRRDRAAALEEQRFGKDPIFTRPGRYRTSEEEGHGG